jgi:hypothetical protein
MKIVECLIISVALFQAYWHVIRAYNWFEFKPFNCHGCMAFWAGVGGVVLSFIPDFYLFSLPFVIMFLIEKYD